MLIPLNKVLMLFFFQFMYEETILNNFRPASILGQCWCFKKENPTGGVNLEQIWFDNVLLFLLSLIVDTECAALVCLFGQPCWCLIFLSQFWGTPCERYVYVVGASALPFLLRAVIKSALMFCILAEIRAIWSYPHPILSLLWTQAATTYTLQNIIQFCLI